MESSDRTILHTSPLTRLAALRFPRRPDAHFYRSTAQALRGKAKQASIVFQILSDAKAARLDEPLATYV